MPKKSRRKKGAAGGSSTTENAVDLDLEALGRDLERVSFDDADSLVPEEEVVEVVFVEPSLKRVQWGASRDAVSGEWLKRCVHDSHHAWRHHLPSSVEPAHLVGRLIPESAQSVSDLAVGKGVVVVELGEGHVDQGLVGQITAANAQALNSDDKLGEMERRFEEQERRFDSKLALWRESINSRWFTETQDLRQKLSVFQEEVRQLKFTIDVLTSEIKAVRGELHQLQIFMKKGLHLSNKVKKRVALTLARSAVEKAVGRTKEESATWSDFMGALSALDWRTVGDPKKLVKKLLADGAFEFNDSIHNIPAEEVVGSIAGMRHGSLRSAWEDIFFIAFKKQVSDEVFAEEVDYAMHQQHMLGEP